MSKKFKDILKEEWGKNAVKEILTREAPRLKGEEGFEALRETEFGFGVELAEETALRDQGLATEKLLEQIQILTPSPKEKPSAPKESPFRVDVIPTEALDQKLERVPGAKKENLFFDVSSNSAFNVIDSAGKHSFSVRPLKRKID